MADESRNQNIPENPDPQEIPVSGDDKTPSQEQWIALARHPKSLLDWLERVHLRIARPNTRKSRTCTAILIVIFTGNVCAPY